MLSDAVMASGALPLPATCRPETYQRHALHGAERIWVEKNCYVDVWIALTGQLGLQPLAMLGSTVVLDFLGDQWSFYKPDHADLRQLYGIQVQELALWRPLQDHVQEHLAAGRLVSVEADAYWLPDTAATDYRQTHTKTTILITQCEAKAETLVYFHNAGLYRLDGEDFRRTMANGGLPMPLFAEWIDTRRRHRLPDEALRGLARARLAEHLAWRPADNPLRRFEARFMQELPRMQAQGMAQGLPDYHAWAFVTTRQLGAAMEMLALHLHWLGGHDAAVARFEQLAQDCKTLILKAARAVASQRPLPAGPLFESMAQAWEQGMSQLQDALPPAATLA